MFDLFPFWLSYSCILVDFMLVSALFSACAGVRSGIVRIVTCQSEKEREYQLIINISVGLQVGQYNPLMIYN